LIQFNKFAAARRRFGSDAAVLPDRYEPMAVSGRSGTSAAGFVRIAKANHARGTRRMPVLQSVTPENGQTARPIERS
jgi:hypothetical protein